MDNLLFCLGFGGATLILIIGGICLMRKYPRIDAGRTNTKPIEQVRAELRERERIRRGEICTDETHWHN